MTELNSVKSLKGEITTPGDKSISHRGIMLGALAKGVTNINNFLEGADCLATIDCFQKLGIEIKREGSQVLVYGKGLGGLSATDGILDVGNSGTTARLLTGILAGQPFESRILGDASLNSRPMSRIITPLTQMNARVVSIRGNDCAPLAIGPNQGTSKRATWLKGIHYHSPVASAQIKSCILLAGLYADGETAVTEPALSRNHTELMLKEFGGDIKTTWGELDSNITNHLNPGYHNTLNPQYESQKRNLSFTSATKDAEALPKETIEIASRSYPTATLIPGKPLYSQEINVPGDISSAAFFIVAGLIVPNSEIFIRNVGVNPTRCGIIEVCQKMGADITLENRRTECGEPVADILVRTSSLKGITIQGEIIPTLIDEIPIIAVMAAMAEGQTIIKDAAELKVKETNRIETVVSNLRNMGVNIFPTDDGMVISGGKPLGGTSIQTYMDHRIAMAFSIAALVATGSTQILDSHCVDVSYPNFYDTLKNIISTL